MKKIPTNVNPTLDALGKLYTLFTTQGSKFKQEDEDILLMLSDRIYALDKPQDYEFSSAEKAQVERLWDAYADV